MIFLRQKSKGFYGQIVDHLFRKETEPHGKETRKRRQEKERRQKGQEIAPVKLSSKGGSSLWT
jgi:hypothetical protein